MTEGEWMNSVDPAAMLDFLVHRSHPDMPWFCTPSDRKLRLFACACCRRAWHLLTDERSRRAVEVAERYADGEAMDEEARAAEQQGRTAWLDRGRRAFSPEDAIGSCFGGPRGDTHLVAAEYLSFATQAALLRCVMGNPWRPVTINLHEWGTYWDDKPILALARAAYEERSGRKCETCEGTGQQGARIFPASPRCPDCHGSGAINDGTLDPDRLAVLADALEEARCEGEECRTCQGKGRYEWWDKDAASMTWAHCGTCNRAGSIPHPLLGHLRSPGPHVRGCHALDCISGRA